MKTIFINVFILKKYAQKRESFKNYFILIILMSKKILTRSEIQKKVAKKKGFKSINDERTYLAKQKGFESYYQYLANLAKKKGFKSYYEYRKHLMKKNLRTC